MTINPFGTTAIRRLIPALTLLAAAAFAQPEPIRAVIVDANADGKPDRRGQSVTITGIVTAPDSIFDTRYLDIYVQDSSAGVNVFSFTMQNAELGDSVIVAGRVDWYRGKTEVSNATVTVVASGRPLPEPRTITCADANRETFEGELVKITGVRTSALILTGNANYTISDASGSTQMRIDAQTEIPGLVCLSDTFTLTCIKSQYAADTLQPLAGYQVLPRYRRDFSRSASDMPVLSIEEVQRPGPDGVTPRLLDQLVRVKGWITGPAATFTVGAKSLYIQDSTAGINVYGCSYDTTRVALLDTLGTRWDVIARVTEYNGLTELANGVMVLADTTRWVPPARLLPFNTGLSESMESDLITVVGDVIQPPVRSGSGYNMTVKNGTPAIAVRINDAARVTLPISRGMRLRITGIVGQYDNSEPYTSGYQLLPRFNADLNDTSAVFEPAEQLKIDTITPNPFAPELGEVATIQLNSPRIGYRLTVEIYDLQGRLANTLLSNAPGGYYDLKWDGTDRLGRRLGPGIYLVAVKAARDDGKTETITRPLVLAVKLN